MEQSKNRSESHRKLRVLCLHGHAASGKAFEDCIRSQWPVDIVGRLDMVFPDAPLALSRDHGGSYEWFHQEQDTKKIYKFDECLRFLEHFMLKYGPFDGILGFSQGAIVGGSLAGIQRNRVAFTGVPRFKFFILISGAKFGNNIFGLPKETMNAYTPPIHCPSLHIIGENEGDANQDEFKGLLKAFVDPVVIRHPGGHIIPPLMGENLAKMMELIQKVEEIPLHGVKVDIKALYVFLLTLVIMVSVYVIMH